MAARLTTIQQASIAAIATATLSVDTPGRGLIDITEELQSFIASAGAAQGTLLLFIRHTSASLLIQENADPSVRSDLLMALDRLAPVDADWLHEVEGPDDMPAHVKAMLTGVSLTIPVEAGRLALGTWQGVFIAEHRIAPHRRQSCCSSLVAWRDRARRQSVEMSSPSGGGKGRLGCGLKVACDEDFAVGTWRASPMIYTKVESTT